MIKALLTVWQRNYTASGNHDADNRVLFVANGNMGMYYVWIHLDAISTLEAFIRELPDGVGAEDGSGAASNPATNKKKRRRNGVAIPPLSRTPLPPRLLPLTISLPSLLPSLPTGRLRRCAVSARLAKKERLKTASSAPCAARAASLAI